MQRRTLNKKAIIACMALIVIVAIFSVWSWLNKFHTLTITTDVSPATLEIDDKTYTFNSNKSIRLSPGLYTYRVVASVDSQDIPITDTVDLSFESKDIPINYTLLKTPSILDAICDYLSYEKAACQYKDTAVTKRFVEDYQWSVIKLEQSGLNTEWAILKMDSGAWSVVGGPGTDISSTGSYPEPVIRALKELSNG